MKTLEGKGRFRLGRGDVRSPDIVTFVCCWRSPGTRSHHRRVPADTQLMPSSTSRSRRLF